MNSLRAFFIFIIKKRMNRLIYKPVETVFLIIVIMLAIALPVMLFGVPRNTGYNNGVIRLSVLSNLYLIVIARFLFKSAAKSDKGSVGLFINKNVLPAFSLAPHRFWALFFYNHIDSFIKMSFFCCSFFILPSILVGVTSDKIIGGCIVLILLSALLTIIGSILPVFLNLYLRLKGAGKYIFVCLKTVSLILVLYSVYGIFIGENPLNVKYSPQCVMAEATMMYLNVFARVDFSIQGILLKITVYLIFFLMLTFLFSPKGLEPAFLYEKIINSDKLETGNKYSLFSRYLSFMPNSIRCLISRELVQILMEKTQLLGMIIQTFIMVVIMIGASAAFDSKLILLGLIITISHSAFSVGLSSIPRENEGIWLIKTIYPRYREVIFSKYLACLLASWIIGLGISAVYSICTMIIFHGRVGLLDLLTASLWGFGFTQPAAIGMGLLLSAVIPFQSKDSDSSIKYSYFGLDGILFLIQVWFLSLPSALAYGLLGFEQLPLKYIYFGYAIILIIGGINSASKKILKESFI